MNANWWWWEWWWWWWCDRLLAVNWLSLSVCLPICTQLGTKRSHLHSAPVTPYAPHIFMINKKYSHSRKSNLVVIASCGLTHPESDPGRIWKRFSWRDGDGQVGGSHIRPQNDLTQPPSVLFISCHLANTPTRRDLLNPGQLQGCTAHSNTLDL